MTRRRILLVAAVVVGAVAATVVVLVVGRDTSDRPRELAIDAVPSCQLISQADLARLDVIAEPIPGYTLEYGEEGTGCRFLSRSGPDVELDVITNHGIDRWTSDDVGGGTTFEDTARIRGFRVVKVQTPGEKSFPEDFCRLYVDVADDQSLKVYLSEADRKKSDPPLCDVANQAAEAAMRTLTSK